MDQRPPEPANTRPSLDPDPDPPTDIPASKIDLDDIPARVAERAPDVLPQRMIGLSFLVLAVLLTMVVIAVALLVMVALNGN
jgi:hypothetical protein